MKDSGEYTANRVIERQLDGLLECLESELEADILTIVGPLYFGLEDQVRDAVDGIKDKRKKLAAILETVGGYIEPAERIANVLRHHYKIVDFVVPNYSMSAGTVLVMCGDSIHMDYFSVLGPIDPQVQRSDDERWMPALGYLRQYERLIEKSQNGTLTTAELAYLMNRFDPAELYSYEQSKALSIALLKEWLVKYKFRNWKKTEGSGRIVTGTMREQRAQEIAEMLNDTEKWCSHGRGISMEVLRRDLNLRIEDFGENPHLNSRLKEYHRLLRDYMNGIGHSAVVQTKGRYRPVFWES